MLGLDFFETNKCDALFSCLKLQLDSHSFVLLYHKQFDYGHDNVFRVVSIETLSIRPGHTKMFPTHIPNWKRLPKQVCELFEPKDKFEPTNEVSASNVFFDFTEEVIPKTIDDKSEKQVTMYKNKTLEVSEIVPEAVMNNTSKMPKSLPVPIKKKTIWTFWKRRSTKISQSAFMTSLGP